MKKLFPFILFLFFSFSLNAKYGDVNNDGFVTSYDITALYNYLLNGDETYLSTSDINGDGYITAYDITCIYNVLLNDSDNNYDGLFRRCYATMATEGSNGANGSMDLQSIDGGYQSFYKQLWNSNELTTDEAINGWGDDGIRPLDLNYYTEKNPMLYGYFLRLYYSIFLCNTYLDKYKDYNILKTAEVRFLRALYYYFAMDAFGNIPYYTESANENNSHYVTAGDGSYSYPVWTWYPSGPQFGNQKSRSEMFAFIENELIEAEKNMAAPTPKNSSHEMYWRADKAAAWLLLSRLYLNAEVYTGTAKWAKAREYAKKVIDSDYQLFIDGYEGTGIDGVHRQFSAYQMLFMGDNGETDASKEAILIIPHNGNDAYYSSWNTSTYLIASTYDGNMRPNPYDPNSSNGIIQHWAGNRMRPNLVNKFFVNDAPAWSHAYDVVTAAGDDRAIFETYYHNLNVDDVSIFWSGHATAKFNNFKCNGSNGSDMTFPDMDIFLFRKAEAYLTYAEALTRLAGGVAPAEAVHAINAIRGRANATQKTSYSLNDILDEWSREFYFEGRRRVDLIRFGKYGGTTDYQWQWKGNTYEGRDFSSFRNVFAIPRSVLAESPELTQNEGYNPFDHDVVIDNAMNISVSTDVQNLYTFFTCNDLSDVLANIPDATIARVVISTDANFSYSMSVDCAINAATNSLSAQVKNSSVNEWIVNNSLSDGSESTTLYAKVVCSGDKCGENYYKTANSNTVQWSLKVNSKIVPELWYMVGNCVGSNDWDNGSGSIGTGLIPLLPMPDSEYDVNGRGTLVYAGYFPAGGQFKFIKTPGDWSEQMNYTNLRGESIVTDEDGDNHNIGIPRDGYYKIEMNTVNRTFTMVKLDGTYPEYATITMPGAYQGWDAAGNAMTAMGKRENTENHEWYVDATYNENTELKFTNGTWDVNWGAATFPFGYGTQGGPSVPVKAGDYSIYFNDILGIYAFMESQNGGIVDDPNNDYLSTQAVDEIVDITGSFSNNDMLKVCSITTNLEDYNNPQLYMIFEDGTKIAIDYNGNVNANQLKNYISSIVDISKLGFKTMSFVVLAQISSSQHICSNSVEVNLLLDNFYIQKTNGERTPMKFVEPGKYTISVSAQDMSFYFLPFSKVNNFDEYKLGSNEPTDGFLFGGHLAKGNKAYEINLNEDPDYNNYVISINLNDMTYNVEGVTYADIIWQVGNANGWGSTSPASGLKNKGWKYARNNDGDYFGFMYLNGYFMFRSNQYTWDDPRWGLGNSEGTLDAEGSGIEAAEGFYMVEANIADLTYNLTPITTIGVIGGFNGWASDYATLTYNTSTGAWEGYCEIPAGTDFKFRANNSWDINWGGSINNLSYDGANIRLDSDGNYFIQLYITYEGDFHVTFTKQ